MEILKVLITAGYGSVIGLDRHNNLIVRDCTNQHANLGPLTQQRAKELSEYLQHLAIHTPER